MKTIRYKKMLIKIHSLYALCVGWLSGYFLNKRIISQKNKWKSIFPILDGIAKDSGLYDKYKDVDVSKLKPIGNKIWVFWYTGLDTAPSIVKKCVELDKALDGSAVIFIDKNNLERYFSFDEKSSRVKELFEEGKISIQTFSDILRCKLISQYGGFWFDATLFCTRKNFIGLYGREKYFSVRHFSTISHTEGKWSVWCLGGGTGNPVFSFIYDMFIEYYNRYDVIFDYFQIDYAWKYLYETFPWARTLIDHTEPSVVNSDFIASAYSSPFNDIDWKIMLRHNIVQKLNRRTLPKEVAKGSYLDYFLNEFHW